MSPWGGGGGGGGTCGARVLRVLLLAVLALAAVEYLFGSILDTGSGLRAYLYASPQHRRGPASQPARDAPPGSDKKDSTWPKRARTRPKSSDSPEDTPLIQSSNSNLTYTNGTFNLTHDITNYTEKMDGVNPSEVMKTLVDVLNILADKQRTTRKTPVKTSQQQTIAAGTTTNQNSNVNAVQIGTMNPSQVSDVLKNTMLHMSHDKENTTGLPQKNWCPTSPPDLGPVEPDKTIEDMAALDGMFPQVRAGGLYAPAHCRSRHKVAIIVPFRDREQHLAVFLNHMHKLLMKQELDYGIFIVEQIGEKPFNRAKLLNVGFVEAQRSRPGGWDCFVFHDIDLLPLDSRNLYTCPRQPRHMSAAIDKYRFSLPYANIFGGVSALTVNQFLSVNGFSNKYWGWGGEDDDMSSRLRKKNYHLSRYPMSIARYTMLEHKPQVANPKRYTLLSQTNKIFTQDGLSSLHYRLIQHRRHPLYTAVLVNIDEIS